MSKNYILSDCDTPVEFVENVEKVTGSKWTVIEKIANAKVPKWKRILIYFFFPLQFMIKYRDAGEVLAWQQMYGILPAFWNRYIFRRRNVRFNIMTFIFKKKKGLAGKLYYWMVNKAISSKATRNIFVFSQSEVEHYGKMFPAAKDKFHFVRLGIQVDGNDYTDEELQQEKYFFSTGMSNRDYEFLVDVFQDSGKKVKIACPGVRNGDGNNIEILEKCYGPDMKRYMYNSYAVVIPLKDINISSGQLVFINAMQMGKPIIITDSLPVRSYLEHEKDAILLPNDKMQWQEAIDRLIIDMDLYTGISVNNRRKGIEEFSVAGLGKNIGIVIKESNL